MAGKTLSYFNLTGGLNTVQTMATINSTPNRTESPDMVNIEYFKLSGIRTMNGNVGLNKYSGITTALNPIPEINKINFGYEYIKGDGHYMIVADKRNLYEYDPLTDRFTLLDLSLEASQSYSFLTPADGTTICGYANGIVAANPSNNYLIYYRKDRYINSSTGNPKSLGTVTASANSNIVTIPVTTTNTNVLNSLGTGDLITINGTKYEISTTSIADDTITITLTSNVSASYEGTDVTLTDFTKIPCVSTFHNQGSSVVITNFMPKIVQSHQGRLWVAAKPDNYDTTSVVIYSDLGAIHNVFEGGDATFYDGGYFEEFWEDTSEITAIGTWDKYIVIHKREHTYLINTSNSDATSWNVESYSDYTCDNQLGFVKANNGYYTYCSSAGGIYPMIQRTIYSAISQGADASTKIRDIFLNLNTYALDEIYAVYHPYKKYIMFYMPIIGESASNNCYILDLQTKSWLHRRIPQNVTTTFEFDNKVYVGTEDGKIYEEFRGTDFDGQPINFSWKSPWFIWSGGTNWTTTREIRVKMSQEGTNNFYIRNRRDGNENYKQRTITNTSNQVHSLMWDEGVLTDDINPDYSNQRSVYEFTGDDGNKWYALIPELDETTKYTPVFDSNHRPTNYNGTKLINMSGVVSSVYYKVAGTSSNYELVDWAEGTKFAYKNTPYQPTYICYQSTKDANIKAWVKRTGDHTTATVNVKDEISTTLWAFYGVDYNRQRNGVILGVKKESYAKSIKNGTTATNIPMYMYNSSDKKWYHTFTSPNNTKFELYSSNKAPYNGYSGYGVAGRYNGTDFTWYSYSHASNTFTSLQLERATAYDKKGETDNEVWNGKTTRSGKTKTVSYYSSNYITIDGVRFNRYSAGDEGQDAITSDIKIVYASTPTLSIGQTVYNDWQNLSNPYGTVSAINDENYTINGKVFVPDSSNNHTDLSNTHYWNTRPIFGDLDTGYNGTLVDTFDIPEMLQIPYPYTTTLDDDSKILTDSKWDGNEEFEIDGVTYPASKDIPPYYISSDTQSTWVNTGQVTKRFPIDRQYFQTLQLEFCGETQEQGIELYGFEVDGIQLTEVPY